MILAVKATIIKDSPIMMIASPQSMSIDFRIRWENSAYFWASSRRFSSKSFWVFSSISRFNRPRHVIGFMIVPMAPAFINDALPL